MCSVNGCTRTGLADLFMVGGVYGFYYHTHTYLCIIIAFLFHSYAQRSTRGWTLNRSKSFLACPTFRLTSLSSHFPSSFLDFLELPAANLHTESMSCYGIIFQLSSCHVLERNRWLSVSRRPGSYSSLPLKPRITRSAMACVDWT